MFTLTPEALHSWVLYIKKKALEVSFFVYLLFAVNNCVKIAFNEYSKVRCALGMQRECCDPFLHSVFLSLLFSCAILQGWERLCMKTQRMMGSGAETELG